MSLTKVNYIDNSTIITAQNLNDIQDNIIELQDNLNDIQDNIVELQDNLENIKIKPKAGFIYPLAASTVPDGFLLCDGAEYLRAEYQELFDAIGTTYGKGDGSATFNVPNLQTRVPVGKGEGYELGNVGGEENHTLTIGEIAIHDHIITTTANTGTIANPGNQLKLSSSAEGATSSGSGYTLLQTSYNGGNQPHNNMQPYTVVNYIIATGKNTGVNVQDIITGVQTLPLDVEYGATSAEMARRNLEITPENIGAMSMELLWENTSPYSSFPPQTINLDLSGGTHIMLGYKPVSGGPNVLYHIAQVGEQSCLVSCMPADNYYKYSIRSREFKVNQDSIVFYEGKEVTAVTDPNANDVYLSVVEIYIIKGI